jgi:hypothetical protein
MVPRGVEEEKEEVVMVVLRRMGEAMDDYRHWRMTHPDPGKE